MWELGRWLNEPAEWSIDGPELTVRADSATDFWQKTHYGYARDSGHFFGVQAAGDFTAELHITGEYKELYDQAGLMVRIDETHWAKTGIELWNGCLVLSSVITAGQSDWAVGPIILASDHLRLRATLARSVLLIEISINRQSWSLLRLGAFEHVKPCLVGPMCCSPNGSGFNAVFSGFAIGNS